MFPGYEQMGDVEEMLKPTNIYWVNVAGSGASIYILQNFGCSRFVRHTLLRKSKPRLGFAAVFLINSQMEDWNCGCQPCLSDMAPKWWWSSSIRWLSLFYWCERSTISMFSGEATCCICLPRYDFPISYSSFMNNAVCKIPVERCFCRNWKFHFHFPKNHW